MNKSKLFYYLIRTLTYPFGFLPYRVIHSIGKLLGLLAFYALRDYRKRALSNLSLAKDLKLDRKELIRVAKRSFQNLAINILEYPRLHKEKDFSKLIICLNPEKALELYNQKKGIIFFCGHQANWEVLFLDGNLRMRGIAIGKPIKNLRLYKWIVSIREKTGGKIIIPQKAMKEGLRNLKQGHFMGIVGDQGMPDSNYSFPFFGRRAWNSTAPALLAYKTNSPIIVATTLRKKGKYYITYSDPLWPDLTQPLDSEVVRLMDKALSLLQQSIKEKLGQWLWQHNRWKQQTPRLLFKRFRHDTLCVILPDDEAKFNELLPHLVTLKQIYFRDFISLYLPEKFIKPSIEVDEIKTYQNIKEVLEPDYRYKLVFNFTTHKQIKKHYKSLSAFEVLNLEELKEIALKNHPDKPINNLSEILTSALCR